MATIFKSFLNNDTTSTRTMTYEAIPLTGALLSSSQQWGLPYGWHPYEYNIKNYSHGMFQSVYDYPYLSSSANHIMDITCGYANSSQISASSQVVQNEKKINIYNQMAQVLMGYDHTGSIQLFDEDGNILAGGSKLRECYFICFSRLLVKDEIKKGSFSMQIGDIQTCKNSNGTTYTITDSGAENDFRVNSPAGEYAVLTASVSDVIAGTSTAACGLIFYQAGVVVLTASIFSAIPDGKHAADLYMTGAVTMQTALTTYEITGCADMFRHRLYSFAFNNTTELNSTIYFCRVNHNEFNYSSNPTYLSSSRIVTKNSSLDQPVSYITTIGLYSADNELLAVAKLSEPLKKTPDTEFTIRTRLDY